MATGWNVGDFGIRTISRTERRIIFSVTTGAFKAGNIHDGDLLAHKPPTGSPPPDVNLPPLPTTTSP